MVDQGNPDLFLLPDDGLVEWRKAEYPEPEAIAEEDEAIAEEPEEEPTTKPKPTDQYVDLPGEFMPPSPATAIAEEPEVAPPADGVAAEVAPPEDELLGRPLSMIEGVIPADVAEAMAVEPSRESVPLFKDLSVRNPTDADDGDTA